MEEKKQREKGAGLSRTVFERSLAFIFAGFGVVVALAWNDAIQSLFNLVFGSSRGSLLAKFIYAFLITVIVTVVSLRIGRDVGPK